MQDVKRVIEKVQKQPFELIHQKGNKNMSEKALCPLLHIWRQVYSDLEEAYQKKNDPSIPAPPIVYNMQGWMLSSDDQKELRWNNTCEWAREHGFEDLIPEFDENDQYSG